MEAESQLAERWNRGSSMVEKVNDKKFLKGERFSEGINKINKKEIRRCVDRVICGDPSLDKFWKRLFLKAATICFLLHGFSRNEIDKNTKRKIDFFFSFFFQARWIGDSAADISLRFMKSKI